MSELLPCPLCGPGKVFLNPPSDVYRHGSINCPACLLTLPGEIKDPSEMIEVWNTRAAIAAMPGEPVAWRWRCHNSPEWHIAESAPIRPDDDHLIHQPLYTAPTSSGWQPIASAPKDGTDILVVCAPDGDSRVVFWDEDMQPGDLGLFAWGITDADKIYFHEKAFTHWMPLPPAPEVTP